MGGIERDNPALRDVLPGNCTHPALNKQRFGQFIDMMGIVMVDDEDDRSKDVLGRVSEDLLSRFAGGAAAHSVTGLKKFS